MEAIRRFLLHITLPMQYFMGKLMMPLPKAEARWFYTAQKCLLPGDCLLNRHDINASNLFIEGFYSHAAIYVGKLEDEVEYVVEAVFEGVKLTPLIDFILDSDAFCAVRPEIALQQRLNAADWATAKAKEGLKYDHEFSSGNNAFYCSELVHMAYWESSPEWRKMFKLKKSLGVETVVPEDFRRAVADDKLDIICEFRG